MKRRNEELLLVWFLFFMFVVAFFVGVFFVRAAMAQQPPVTVEQRLAVSIANLTLQNASCATQADALMAENTKLKAQIDALKKPETDK